MEPLPRGANFKRAKMLWEIGLHIAGDPAIPYGGNRDMCITVGSGGQADFRPSLKLASGSAIMAHDVVAGNIDMAFVNPSALLTQAYRGVGLFETPLPLRIVASYPSWDQFAIVAHERTGLKTVQDIKDAKYPLKLSIREDPNHSTLVLIEQIFSFYGFSLDDLVQWGGELKLIGGPGDVERRLNPLRDGTLDAAADEGLPAWFDEALAHGYAPVDFSDDCFEAVCALGWRKMVIRPGDYYTNLTRDYACFNFGGWPIYTRESMAEEAVYDVCAAIVARQAEIPWEQRSWTDILLPFTDSDATPMDVPLHPGAERWLAENRGLLR
jgi:TRAP-type uncharacterized transport system substrate-binding protein